MVRTLKFRLLLYGISTLLLFALSVGLWIYGNDIRIREELIDSFTRDGNLEYNRSLARDIQAYRERKTVRFFTDLGFLDTFSLEVALCSIYSDMDEIEQALVYCSNAVVVGEKEGYDTDILIYNRAMVHLKSALEEAGALSSAEVDLREVSEIANARVYLEKIYSLIASKKEESAKQRGDGETDENLPPLFNDQSKPGQERGY